MSLSVAVDLRNPTPPFEQVRRQLSTLIETGRLEADERLPSVRQLAADLGLATGTVARAYKELEASGHVTTRRGGGTRVAPGHGLASTSTLERLDATAEDYLARARELGASPQQALRAVERAARPS